jgi:prephenate dehydratase
LPLADFDSVVLAVANGQAELGIIPVENSVIGGVRVAQAALAAADDRLVVVAETSYPIRHCLLALPGAAIAAIRTVESHPAALAQCAAYLARHRLTPRPASDTAGAARDIAADRNFTRAAIAGSEAAERYGLAILDRDIADVADNRTRFVVVAPASNVEPSRC